MHKVVRTAKELFGISLAGWIAEELEYVHSVTVNKLRATQLSGTRGPRGGQAVVILEKLGEDIPGRKE